MTPLEAYANACRPDETRYYTELANGRREYWTYSDGDRAYVTKAFVERELRRSDIHACLVAVC